MPAVSAERPAADSTPTRRTDPVLCQLCGVANPDGLEKCRNCGHKLLVVSGISGDDRSRMRMSFSRPRSNSTNISSSGSPRSRRPSESSERDFIGRRPIGPGGAQPRGGACRGREYRQPPRGGRRRHSNRDRRRMGANRASGAHRPRSGPTAARAEARILSHARHDGHASEHFRASSGHSNPPSSIAISTALHVSWPISGRWPPTTTNSGASSARPHFPPASPRSPSQRSSGFSISGGPTSRPSSTSGTRRRTSDTGTRPLGPRTGRTMAPESFLPDFALGGIELRRGNHRRAVHHLEASVAREELPQSLYLLGSCRLQLGESGRAITALKRAVELDPSFEEAIDHLGAAYLRRGWTRLALETFQTTRKTGSPAAPLPRDCSPARRQAAREAPPERHVSWSAPTRHSGRRRERDRPRSLRGRRPRSARGTRPQRHRRPSRFDHGPNPASRGPRPTGARRRDAPARPSRRPPQRRCSSPCGPRADHGPPDGWPTPSIAVATTTSAAASRPMSSPSWNPSSMATSSRARALAREALEITPRELRSYPLAALAAIALRRGRLERGPQLSRTSHRTA